MSGILGIEYDKIRKESIDVRENICNDTFKN